MRAGGSLTAGSFAGTSPRRRRLPKSRWAKRRAFRLRDQIRLARRAAKTGRLTLAESRMLAYKLAVQLDTLLLRRTPRPLIGSSVTWHQFFMLPEQVVRSNRSTRTIAIPRPEAFESLMSDAGIPLENVSGALNAPGFRWTEQAEEITSIAAWKLHPIGYRLLTFQAWAARQACHFPHLSKLLVGLLSFLSGILTAVLAGLVE
jgi:hypothetical protein